MLNLKKCIFRLYDFSSLISKLFLSLLNLKNAFFDFTTFRVYFQTLYQVINLKNCIFRLYDFSSLFSKLFLKSIFLMKTELKRLKSLYEFFQNLICNPQRYMPTRVYLLLIYKYKRNPLSLL